MYVRYKVLIAPAAQRAFDRLPGDVRRKLRVKIDDLVSDPRGPKTQKLQARGGLYRIRSVDHRILYRIEDRRSVENGVEYSGIVYVEEFMNRRDDYRR